eukprot:GHVU01135714.1.p1 GENE.GHVU01135714.1~~GHVU01135714.1.p1  ORF type:complete len:455 (+),score=61.63 GHVU01135714.1:584-1948(+)
MHSGPSVRPEPRALASSMWATSEGYENGPWTWETCDFAEKLKGSADLEGGWVPLKDRGARLEFHVWRYEATTGRTKSCGEASVPLQYVGKHNEPKEVVATVKKGETTRGSIRLKLLWLEEKNETREIVKKAARVLFERLPPRDFIKKLEAADVVAKAAKWHYMDDAGSQQGPFSSHVLLQWLLDDWFDDRKTIMKRDGGTKWMNLVEALEDMHSAHEIHMDFWEGNGRGPSITSGSAWGDEQAYEEGGGGNLPGEQEARGTSNVAAGGNVAAPVANAGKHDVASPRIVPLSETSETALRQWGTGNERMPVAQYSPALLARMCDKFGLTMVSEKVHDSPSATKYITAKVLTEILATRPIAAPPETDAGRSQRSGAATMSDRESVQEEGSPQTAETPLVLTPVALPLPVQNSQQYLVPRYAGLAPSCYGYSEPYDVATAMKGVSYVDLYKSRKRGR